MAVNTGVEDLLTIRDLSVSFTTRTGVTNALEDVSLDIRRGGFVSVVGPSGCGKSTLLQAISGLHTQHSGGLTWASDDWKNSLGYVFQKDALLPWKTAIDNVALGLKIRGVDEDERRVRAADYLDRMGLEGFHDYFPGELSGGMRQRVAVARTLIYEPSLVLMDEPFGALDAQNKALMQELFMGVWQGLQPSVIFVTHDLAEAIYMSEKVVLMSKGPGRIKKIIDVPLPRPRTSPMEIWTDPEFRDIYLELWALLREEL